MRQRNGQAANDVANTRDDYYAELQNQVVYLDDNSHEELKVKHKESYVKPSRYGSSAYQQSVADTSHHTDYASDADYAYDSDPSYYGDKPNCDEGITRLYIRFRFGRLGNNEIRSQTKRRKRNRGTICRRRARPASF